jgi:exopolyphosphatase/guanosine-5'-triphosphate,3'-diphosphate pyrophosphatase
MTHMGEIVPRWEWRTFGSSFGVAEERFAALEPTGVQESDELYLVSATDANVKVRDDLMDVKVLVETNSDGLEQWRPIMKAEFPVGSADVARIFDALGLKAPALGRETYTLDAFKAELAPAAGLRPINVHKRRVRYKVGGCTSEVTDTVADGIPTRTIAIESEDAAAVVAAVASMGLAPYVNTSYGKGLTAAVDHHDERYAVIDVGTNSVKFHIGERQPDGSWRRIVDRAEMSRLGEGLNESGMIGPDPLARTAQAVTDMADEARREGVMAITAVGTAVFRIASNGADAVAAIKRRSGVEVEVISGEEESRLAYLAAKSTAPDNASEVVVFDTGGGSSQFTYGRGSSVVDRFSVNVGAVSYTERFALDQSVTPEALAEAVAAIKADLGELSTRPRPDAVVGMGGAVTNMTAVSKHMTQYDPDAIQGSVLSAAEIDRQIQMYSAISADERRQVAGLQPKRAEVILAGACIVRTILEELGVDSFTVSDRGLRHGVLLERFAGTQPKSQVLEEVR